MTVSTPLFFFIMFIVCFRGLLVFVSHVVLAVGVGVGGLFHTELLSPSDQGVSQIPYSVTPGYQLTTYCPKHGLRGWTKISISGSRVVNLVKYFFLFFSYNASQPRGGIAFTHTCL